MAGLSDVADAGKTMVGVLAYVSQTIHNLDVHMMRASTWQTKSDHGMQRSLLLLLEPCSPPSLQLHHSHVCRKSSEKCRHTAPLA